MSSKDDNEQFKVKAKWADLSPRPRVVYGTRLFGIGKICVAIAILIMLALAFQLDPILSKPF